MTPSGEARATKPWPHSTIAGLRIDMPAFAQVLHWLGARIASGAGGHVCHVDAHVVVKAQSDPDLARALADSALALPDGMPLVWLGRARGLAAERVYGPDFMRALLDASQQPPLRDSCAHFFYGGSARTLAALTAMVTRTYPAARIAGQFSPPFGPQSADAFDSHLARIRQSGANVVWVGLGAPRQEKWAAAAAARLPGVTVMAVGAAFDFLAGTKPQAPRFIRANGLEWAFRWLSEPGRLTRRYGQVIPTFLWLIVRDAIRRRFRQTPPV